jgi:hypothetical protein
MVVMAVAQHQRIEPSGINAQEFQVVDQRLRRVAAVDEDLANLTAALCLDVHREAELADQRLSRRQVGEPPAEAFDVDAAYPGARRKAIW